MLEVTLFLQPEKNGNDGCALSSSSVLELLDDRDIIFGINTEAVEAAVTFFIDNPDSTQTFLIAAGTTPTEISSPIELLFSEETVRYELEGEGDETISRTYSQAPLVRPETLLAQPFDMAQAITGRDVFGNEIAATLDDTATKVVSGENVEFCKDTGSFQATASGYPTMDRTIENEVELLTISVEQALQISPDAMSAKLALRPPPPNTPPPEPQSLARILDEKRVTFGILNNQIQTCINTVVEKRVPMEIIAAMGMLPQDGTDAKLHFEIEVGPLPGKIRGDGSIDFRERKMFVGVNKDQLIAVKKPQTAGIAGKNVHGSEVPQKPGQDLNIKVTDDAVYNPETGEVRAARSGVLSLVTENSVKVCAKQVVSGDVDFTTGNIISRDSLEIGGSILPQFKVIAFGDIKVGGNVEKANLRSDANIIIKGGIIGRRSRVQARGDIDIHFLEHGRVFAKGNIVLRKSAYYCRLHSWKDFFCPPTVKIIASQVVAAGSLTMGDVGADNADAALVAASIDPESLQLLYDYRRARDTKQLEMERLCQLVGADSQNQAFLDIQQELQSTNEALRRLNLVPDMHPDAPPESTTHLPREHITIHGTIYAGTIVRIGNVTIELADNLTRVRFQAIYNDTDTASQNAQPTITAIPIEK